MLWSVAIKIIPAHTKSTSLYPWILQGQIPFLRLNCFKFNIIACAVFLRRSCFKFNIIHWLRVLRLDQCLCET